MRIEVSRWIRGALGCVLAAVGGATAVAAGPEAGDIATPAPADDGTLAEIVITAERREETLQKSSVALQVVSQAELQNAGVVQMRDLTTVVPGLQIANGGAATQIYIRGVGDFGSTPITNPAVATNLDGVYIARPQGVEGNFFDIARVEVLKGPRARCMVEMPAAAPSTSSRRAPRSTNSAATATSSSATITRCSRRGP